MSSGMILSRLSVVATAACIIVTGTTSVSAEPAPAEEIVKSRAAASESRSVPSRTEQDGTPIPEPSNIILLALGITGLVVGRYAAKRHQNNR
ncbi:MAG: PEP-CTERM sorting domain-containing protein [Pseudomonadota bacterium]